MARWRRIVVGLDGSEPSRRALVWAAQESREHGAELLAVTTWTALPPPIAYPFAGFPEGWDKTPMEAATHALQQVLGEVLGEDPSARVQTHAVEGDPAKVLVDLAAEADLVVVGALGHGGFAGWLIGSVSRDVVAHAACTVVVVR